MKNTILKHLARALCRMPAPVVRLLGGAPIRIDGQTLDPVVQMMVRHFTDPPGTVPPLADLRHGFDTQGSWLTHPPAPGIDATQHSIPGPASPIPIELHRPQNLSGAAPALLFFHGGGHAGGSISSHRGICRQLAHAAQCVVIAVDYRLAPEHPFPAGINDSLAAFDHLTTYAAEFGLDPNRIAVGGDSAGGNIAAVIAQQRRDAPHPPVFQILWVPWVDLSKDHPSYDLFETGFFLEKSQLHWYRDQYLSRAEQATDPQVSPLLGDVTGTCPAALLVTGFDPLRDEGRAYADKLTKAGVPTTLRLYEGAVHPFINVAGYVPLASEAFDDASALLRTALHQTGDPA